MSAGINFPPISDVLNWRSIVFGGTPFALNKVGLITLVAAGLTLLLFFVAGHQAKLVPGGVQNFVESIVDFINNSIVYDVMGSEGAPWAPYLTGLFCFILFCNLFEVIPFIQMPATARMSIPAPLALMVWVTFIVVGIRNQGIGHYFKNAVIPSGVPGALLVILIPLEILSNFIVRPFALAVRLFGNLLAGHLLLLTFAVISEAMFVRSIGLVVLPLPFAMLTALTGYEIFVSALQAFIFTILSALYIAEAMKSQH
ncbi:MAG: F0F1 ATP synthase subunit A [Acidimicrobiaceae bacterium]|nr:F0F1 ATP synthase subunit A [Acidimicrobiaceae bacterium]